MAAIIGFVFYIADALLGILVWVIILNAVVSWLVAFGVVNNRNQIVNTVGRALEALVEPALKRIRRFVPMMGNVDISPVILFLVILLIQLVIGRVITNLAS